MRSYKKKKFKLPFTQGRNIGLSFKRRYRNIQIQIYFLLKKYRKEDNKIELSEEEYKELLSKVLELPEIITIIDPDERELAAKKSIEFTMYKLMISGDLVIGGIEAADTIMRQKELIEEARDEKDFKAALDGNAKLLEAHGFIKTHRDDGTERMAFKLSQSKNGDKEALMIGTGAECLAAIRQALSGKAPIMIEEKK